MARPVGIPSHRKGLSLEQEYGIDKASKIRKKSGWSKGLTKESDPRVSRGAAGKKDNPEFREMRRRVQTQNYKDPDYRKRQLDVSMKGGFGGGHMKGKRHKPESNLKNSLAHIGKVLPESARKKQGESIRKKILSGEFSPGYTGWFRKDIGKTLKSKQEANFCRLLSKFGVEWEYETHRFRISDGSIYVCDFFLPQYSLNIELKPGKVMKNMPKIIKFALENPNIKFKILDRQGYQFLQQKYSDQIEGWEWYGENHSNKS